MIKMWVRKDLKEYALTLKIDEQMFSLPQQMIAMAEQTIEVKEIHDFRGYYFRQYKPTNWSWQPDWLTKISEYVNEEEVK
jgi:hypothetical protein